MGTQSRGNFGQAGYRIGGDGECVEELSLGVSGGFRGFGCWLTLIARPAALYSSNKGATFSASKTVDTIMLTGPVPSPT